VKLKEFLNNAKKDSHTPEEMVMRLRMLYVITTFAIIILFTLGVGSLLENNYSMGILDLSCMFSFLAALYYLKKSNNYFTATSIGVGVISVLFLIIFATGGDENTGHLWIFTYPLFTFFLLGSKRGIIVNTMMFLIILLFFKFGHLINGTIQYSNHFIFRFIPSFLVVIVYSFIFEEFKKQIYRKLVRQKSDLLNTVKELREKKEELLLLRNGLEKIVNERTKQLLDEIESRKKAQAKISENEKKFRLLFENSPIGMYVYTPEGKVKMVNKALVQMLGYPSEKELMKVNVNNPENFVDFDREKFNQELLTKGKVIGFKSIWKKYDGNPIYIQENASVLKNERGEIIQYQGTVEDITKIKEFEEALIEAKEKAEESDRLKSEFLAQISHEIRTPVNSILSFTNLLKEEISELGITDLMESFNMIENGGRRLIRTVDLILNMSELQNGTYQPAFQDCDLAEDIIKPILFEFKTQAESKNIKLELNNNLKKTCYIEADDYTVTQIFVQLIDNAIKFTYEGKVEINLSHDDEFVNVEIKDTGIGISKEYQERIFKPFCQEDRGYTRKFDGNGLGLSLVKKCIEINNAKISIQSEKDVGTVFTVSFKRKYKDKSTDQENINSNITESNN